MLSNTKSSYMGKNFQIAVFVMLFTFQLSAQDISFTQKENNELNCFYVDLVSKAATLNGSWGLFGGARAGYNRSEYNPFGYESSRVLRRSNKRTISWF